MKRLKKVKGGTVVMEDEDGISQMFEYLKKKYESEPNWINVKSKPVFAEYELELIAHNGSGFYSLNTLNNLPSCCRIINPIETARGLITVKIFHAANIHEASY